MPAQIYRVSEPVAGFAPLAAAARGKGFLFLDRLAAQWRSGARAFAGPGACLFAAYDFSAHEGGRLAGLCGLNRDPYGDDPQFARVRRLYVDAAYRGHGLGRRLVAQVLDAATPRFTSIRLRTERASAFFEALGFTPVSDLHATHVLRFAAPVCPVTPNGVTQKGPGSAQRH